jgi:hypothetical protein
MTHYIQRTMCIYFRYNNNETVMVLINNSNETKTIKTDRFKENIKNFKRKCYFWTYIWRIKRIIIEPKSVLILELK